MTKNWTKKSKSIIDYGLKLLASTILKLGQQQ